MLQGSLSRSVRMSRGSGPVTKTQEDFTQRGERYDLILDVDRTYRSQPANMRSSPGGLTSSSATMISCRSSTGC